MEMDLSDRIESLRRCGALASAPGHALEWLAEGALVEAFEPDQIVSAQGELASRVYVVVSGQLQILQGEAGRLISIAEAGSLFGEYAMFVQGQRTAYVVAAAPTVTLSFAPETFREFLMRAPSVTLELLQTAVRRLHRAERNR